MAEAPNFRKAARHSAGVMPMDSRAIITSRTANCFLNSSQILCAFSREMPLIVARRSGSFSRISKVRSPKASTIFSAVAARMPLTAPEERYFRSCPAVEGRLRSQSSARNWRPKEACTSQCPISRSSSPADSAGRTPTTVTSSPSLFKSSTVKPVSGR